MRNEKYFIGIYFQPVCVVLFSDMKGGQSQLKPAECWSSVIKRLSSVIVVRRFNMHIQNKLL